MKLALIGATGLVGSVMIKVLEERNFPISEFIPVASEKSIGKLIEFKGKKYPIIGIKEALNLKPALAIFSAGGTTSLEWAPQFADSGTTVIDNSSAWRMDPTIKLVVPEINAHVLSKQDKIIANPNCSTIQLVMALAPLHVKYGIKRIIVSTYQSVTGTGVKALTQLENERAGILSEKAYRYAIDKNCIPQCDVFTENGYTKEEMKLVNEPRKIFNDNSLQITATAVRVPVVGGHSESVNVEFKTDFDLTQIREILGNTKGITLKDNIDRFEYPMPLDASGKDDVFVGRLRRDESNPNTLNMWIVADNLRKGAATNAIQIAEYLFEKKLL